MAEIPAFFLPDATPDAAEAEYALLASRCGVAVPAPGKRVRSITFEHDGAEWTATVGETLRGTSRGSRRSRGLSIERTESLSDQATVRAIFEGDPFKVMTNGFRTQWANPLYAGKPRQVLYFSTPKACEAGSLS